MMTNMQETIRRPRWSKEDVRILKKMYISKSNREIATVLHRTVASVTYMGFQLGLSKGPTRLREMGRENIAIRWAKRGKAARTKSKSAA